MKRHLYFLAAILLLGVSGLYSQSSAGKGGGSAANVVPTAGGVTQANLNSATNALALTTGGTNAVTEARYAQKAGDTFTGVVNLNTNLNLSAGAHITVNDPAGYGLLITNAPVASTAGLKVAYASGGNFIISNRNSDWTYLDASSRLLIRAQGGGPTIDVDSSLVNVSVNFSVNGNTTLGDAITDTTSIGTGSAFKALLSATAVLDFPSIAAADQQELTVTVTGLSTNDAVMYGAPLALEAGLSVSAYVSAVNTVTIRLSNVTALPIDPASATWRVSGLHY